MGSENEEDDARRQAARVERYWRDQGYLVKSWVEPVKRSDLPKCTTRARGAPIWAVRSDLPVGGHPTRKVGG
jgi:hypothetical protein